VPSSWSAAELEWPFAGAGLRCRDVVAPIDERERLQLCDLLQELGPDAPTLCAGWTTSDMAAHLVLREHFRRWGDDARATEKAKGYSYLVSRLRAGPPAPWRVPGVRTLANGLEYFIHHEDVRRANGRGPRDDIPDLEGLCWRMTGFLGRRLASSTRPFALELRSPDGRHRSFGTGTKATLTGRPTELVLFAAGRRSAAQVGLSGPDDAVAAVVRSRSAL
jgi:uncharacterized protein (TIGR03085 family)